MGPAASPDRWRQRRRGRRDARDVSRKPVSSVVMLVRLAALQRAKQATKTFSSQLGFGVECVQCKCAELGRVPFTQGGSCDDALGNELPADYRLAAVTQRFAGCFISLREECNRFGVERGFSEKANNARHCTAPRHFLPAE